MTLFPDAESSLRSAPPVPPPAAPRLREANRTQVCLRPVVLEDLLPEDHQARIVWTYVEGLDLTLLYQAIAAVDGEAGRPATDPKILLALWLYATLEGVGAARALNRLCPTHVAYQWLCGGVPMNYHTLADFRTAQGAFPDTLLTQGVATLMAQGLVSLERVAQYGMRVRASAGAASFRRRQTLAACLAEAEVQVQALRAKLDADPAATTRRQQRARERAARDRTERVAQALAQLPALEAKWKPEDRTEARASTTDPEARVMKLADGGYRPAYNLQFATDTGSQVIVGVAATHAGSDRGQLAPMVDQLAARHAQAPGARWWTAASRPRRTSRRSAIGRPCTPRCRSRRTQPGTRMPPSRRTVWRSRRGGNEWAPPRPRRSTRSGRPPPSA